MSFSVGNSLVVDSSRNVVLGRLDADLGSATAGTVFFNNSLRVVRGWNGTQWASLTQGASATQAWSVGSNVYGQLGDGTSTARSSPVSAVGGFTDWIQVSAGRTHSAGVRSNGQIWSWGNNGVGRLGDGTITTRSSPVSVVGGFTNWTQVDVGLEHTAAIRANGQAWTWGRARYGKLGDNTTTDRSSPVSVVGGFTDWVQISAGNYFTIGIRSNGEAWGWGSNASGEIGNVSVNSCSSPMLVVGGFTDWIQVSGGGNHTSAIRANGTAWGWGLNFRGQLGDNTTTARFSPVSVVGGFTDWVHISAAAVHTAAIRANGTAWTWGYNGTGRLGDGTTTNRSSPVLVVGGFTDWVQIEAASRGSMGLRANGQLWSWGYNLVGQLADNTTTNTSSPVSAVGGFTDWVQISGKDSFHTLALRVTTI